MSRNLKIEVLNLLMFDGMHSPHMHSVRSVNRNHEQLRLPHAHICIYRSKSVMVALVCIGEFW